MPKKLIELNKDEQIVLRQAIESAVQKKYPGVKSFSELDREQRDNLGDAIQLNRQTLETFFNGGEIIRCQLASLNLIIRYIGETSWLAFLENNLKKQDTEIEASQIPFRTAQMGGPDVIETNFVQTDGSEATGNQWRNAAVVLIVLILLALVVIIPSRKVNKINVSAQLVVNAVTFVLEAPAEFNRIEVGDFIRTDSAILHGAPVLDGKKNKITARAISMEQPVILEQFHIPAGVQVTVEAPVTGQLFIKLLTRSPSAEAQVSGSISRFSNLVVDKKIAVDASEIGSFTKAISFRAPLKKSEVFELALVNAKLFDMQWMVVKEIRFRQKDNFHDTGSRSSIVRGSISFPSINDSILLQMFDDFEVTASTPVRMSLKPSPDGIHVSFSGEVNEMSVGSRVLLKPDVSIMPSIYESVTTSVPDLLWLFVGVALTIMAFIFLQRLWRSKGVKAMKLFALLVVALATFRAHAQIAGAEGHRSNAVRVYTSEENGSGFICSSNKDSTFVVSAYHVIDHAKGSIQVAFADGQTVSGKVVFRDSVIDLVVIGTRPIDFKWNLVPIAADVELGERVFYITVLEADRPILPREAIATIDMWDFDIGFQYASVPGVTAGDSGAALLCDRGIAGIILTQQVKALDIRVARDRICSWNKEKWKLTENP